MAELHVNVDGQMARLADCTWVFARHCGHPFGVLLAQLADPKYRHVVADEAQAWQQFYERARDRRAAQKRGVTVRLAATATLGDEFWRWMKDGCSCDSEVSDG